MVFSILKNSLTGHTGPPHFINFHALSLCVCVCVCVCACVWWQKQTGWKSLFLYLWSFAVFLSVPLQICFVREKELKCRRWFM